MKTTFGLLALANMLAVFAGGDWCVMNLICFTAMLLCFAVAASRDIILADVKDRAEEAAKTLGVEIERYTWYGCVWVKGALAIKDRQAVEDRLDLIIFNR